MASSKKIVVGKSDLRRLMKEKQTSLNSSSKKIDSPLAKYNALGKLSCVLCNALVKNDLLWNAHVQGRTHKESLARLKAEKDKKEHTFVQPPEPVKAKKRKLDDEELLAISRGEKPMPVKNKSKHDSKSSLPTESTDLKKPRSILKTSAVYHQQKDGCLLGIGGYDSAESEDDKNDTESEATEPVPAIGGSSKVSLESGLPSDFFDAGVVPSAPVGGSSSENIPEPAAMAEQLPEGFFDDPKMDAKVRKVEYRDKMDEEWEIFQRTMKEEHHVSEVITAEDDEVANEERNLVEVEEQLKKWSKIDELAKRKEKLMLHEKETVQQSSSDDEATVEEEFDEFPDWRSKEAWI